MSAAAIRRMLSAGLTIDQALLALESIEAEEAIPWSEKWRSILERDRYICNYCGAPNSRECDHVIPRSRGGRNTDDNLVASCKSCNSAKKDRTPEEWRRS